VPDQHDVVLRRVEHAADLQQPREEVVRALTDAAVDGVRLVAPLLGCH